MRGKRKSKEVITTNEENEISSNEESVPKRRRVNAPSGSSQPPRNQRKKNSTSSVENGSRSQSKEVVTSSEENESSTDEEESAEKRRKRNAPSGSSQPSRSQRKKTSNSSAENRTRSQTQEVVTRSEENESSSDEEESAEQRKRNAPSGSSQQSQRKKITKSNKSKRVRRSRDVQSSSQPYAFSQQRVGTSVPGVIKSLRLQNFMCHGDFTHHFHSNLNFITGQNGSGKSALLSGILVALGGKASVTSRTNSLKSLIQKGKNTARVSVTLTNINGLRRYGDEFTIERWINQSGSGGYRIKCVGGEGEQDQWRQLKRQELENILNVLNIQIDNPVAILNQEVARSFLRSKDPKVKFNLFYEGTLLSKLESVLEDTRKELDETKSILKQQGISIHMIKKEISRLKSKVDKIDELNIIKAKLAKIRGEYLWALVIESENDKEKAENEVTKNAKELEILTKKLEETKDRVAGFSEESIVAEQADVRQQLNEKRREFDEVRTELVQLKNTVSTVRLKLKSAVSTIASKEAQVNKLSAQIEKLRAENEAKAREETNEEKEKLNELQEQQKHLESVSKNLKQDAENFKLNAENARERMQEVAAQERHFLSQVEMKKRSIANLGDSTNKYAPFGPRMVELMAKIEINKHRFRKPPRGPLGACFRVKDSQFVVLVEALLKNYLTSFVVDNGRDLNLLRELINSVYNSQSYASQRRQSGVPPRQPGIIMSPFYGQQYDISKNKSSIPNAPTVFDVIEVENDDHVVTNALIDMADIERVLLFKNNEAACHVLKEESRCPPMLKHAYSLQWYRFTPAPNFAARVLPKLNQAQVLKSGRNKEVMKRELEREMASLKSEIQSLAPTKAEINREISEHQSMYEKKMLEVQQKLRELGETTNQIKRHVEKMKQREQRFDFSSFNEELEELKEDLQKHMSEREELTEQVGVHQPRLVSLDAQRKKLQEEVEALTTKLAGFAEARDQLKSKKTELENIMKRIQTKIESLESTKASLVEKLKKIEEVVQGKTLKAIDTHSARIETTRSPDDLRKEFDAMKIRISETEAQLGDQDELRDRLDTQKLKYNKMMQEYGPLFKMHRLLEKIMTQQEDSFIHMKNHMGRTLTLFFSVMAKQRGYEGRLLADFDTRELYYFVCPDGDSSSKTIKAIDAQQNQQGNPNRRQDAAQIKQQKLLKKALIEYSLGLSGGERSFATICFILALWQVMECPFYMLDEFDVFMDAFNRKTSQQALMAHAKKFHMHQFVLFTPLDLGEVPGPEEACVLRLFPPVRGGRGGGAGGSNSPTGGEQSNGGGGGETGRSGARTRGRGRPGKSNRNSEDCVENVDPIIPSHSKSSRGDQRKNGHGSQVLGTPNKYA